MKTNCCLKNTLVTLFLFLFIPFQLFSTEKNKIEPIPVAEAIKKGLVEVEILSKGSHKGDCMTMTLQSRANDSLFLAIESGRRLASIDTNMQDILIVAPEEFLLTFGSKKRLSIYGFCCQANMSSPFDSAVFAMGPMGDSNLVAVAAFLNEHDYPLDIAQEAVWAISDNHPVSAVYEEDVQGLEELKNFLSELKGEELQWYSAEYQDDDNVLFTNRVEYITGELEIWVPHNCYVDIQVEDAQGKVMEVFEQMVAYHPGRYFYEFKFPVIGWTEGKYYLVVRTDGNVLYRKLFEI